LQTTDDTPLMLTYGTPISDTRATIESTDTEERISTILLSSEDDFEELDVSVTTASPDAEDLLDDDEEFETALEDEDHDTESPEDIETSESSSDDAKEVEEALESPSATEESICANVDFDQLRDMRKSEIWLIEECLEEDLKSLLANARSLNAKYSKERKAIYKEWRAAKAKYEKETYAAHQDEKSTIAKMEDQVKGIKFEILKLKKIASPTHYARRKLEEVVGFKSELPFDQISRMKRSEVWKIVEGKQEDLKKLEIDVSSKQGAYSSKQKTRDEEWNALEGKFEDRRKANRKDKKLVDAAIKAVKAKKRDIKKTKHIVYHVVR